jgi:hypothetical protein
MSTSNSVSKLTKGLATTLIIAGFSAMIYIFVIQTRYLQPAYLTPHPEFGRVVPFVFKGLVRYLTQDEKFIFQYGFFVGLASTALGAYWRQGLERHAFWTRELIFVVCFLTFVVVLALQ